MRPFRIYCMSHSVCLQSSYGRYARRLRLYIMEAMNLTVNRRARFDYETLETHEAGIELKGFEVKASRAGRINLAGAYVIIRNREAWLVNCDIPPYQQANTPLYYDAKRGRRLLLERREIESLRGRTEGKGLTLVPLAVYTNKRRIKVLVGLCRNRKKQDKRELIKKRVAEREMRRETR